MYPPYSPKIRHGKTINSKQNMQKQRMGTWSIC